MCLRVERADRDDELPPGIEGRVERIVRLRDSLQRPCRTVTGATVGKGDERPFACACQWQVHRDRHAIEGRLDGPQKGERHLARPWVCSRPDDRPADGRIQTHRSIGDRDGCSRAFPLSAVLEHCGPNPRQFAGGRELESAGRGREEESPYIDPRLTGDMSSVWGPTAADPQQLADPGKRHGRACLVTFTTTAR